MSRDMDLRVMPDEDPSATPEQRACEMALATQMQGHLLRNFPGYGWLTGASVWKGLVWVRIPALMGPTLSYCEHYSRVQDDDALRRFCRKAGGEILERFRQPREGFNIIHFQDAYARRITHRKQKMPEG